MCLLEYPAKFHMAFSIGGPAVPLQHLRVDGTVAGVSGMLKVYAAKGTLRIWDHGLGSY